MVVGVGSKMGKGERRKGWVGDVNDASVMGCITMMGEVARGRRARIRGKARGKEKRRHTLVVNVSSLIKALVECLLDGIHVV